MNKLIYSLLLVTLTTFAFDSFSSINVFKQGAKWNKEFVGMPWEESKAGYFLIDGNITLEDTTYMVLKQKIGEEPIKTLGYLFIDGDKIYYRVPNSDTSHLIYDFNMSVGDSGIVYLATADINDPFKPFYLTCTNVYNYFDSVNHELEVMEFSGYFGNLGPEYTMHGIWIKGIGSLFGPAMNIPCETDYGGPQITEVSCDGITYYLNGISGINKLTAENNTYSNTKKYDLTGIINGNSGKIYIQNGKKYINSKSLK